MSDEPTPTPTPTVPSIIFIVPYRNRPHQKTHFRVYMKYVLEDLSASDYEIYFAHQCDTRPFNRGATKNIGFLAMKKKYPNDYKNINFIFNDVDTIPTDKNIIQYDTQPGIVKHFYGFTFALGGIFSIRGADFERANGFPGFWGWGMEDNAMNNRVLATNSVINRANFYPLGTEKIIQHLDKPFRLIANKDTSRYKENTQDGLSTIRNLKYTIDNEMINITNFENSIDPNKEEFYTQNMAVDDKVHFNALEKMRKANRWQMSNMMR